MQSTSYNEVRNKIGASFEFLHRCTKLLGTLLTTTAYAEQHQKMSLQEYKDAFKSQITLIDTFSTWSKSCNLDPEAIASILAQDFISTTNQQPS